MSLTLTLLSLSWHILFSEKIHQDFSNYSAWHYRTVLINRLHPLTSTTRWSVIQEEFSFARQAFYVEPADQSAWLYYRWLMAAVANEAAKTTKIKLPTGLTYNFNQKNSSSSSTTTTEHAESQSDSHSNIPPATSSSPLSPSPLEIFTRELDECRSLDSIEPDCKWVLLTIAILLACCDALRNNQESNSEQAEIFDRLRSIDPMRSNYYSDMQKSIAHSDEDK